MRITVISQVNPKDLLINKRYANNRKLDPAIVAAQTKLAEDAEAVMESEGVFFDEKARLGIEIWFVMNDRRADTDGPLKRTIDGLSKGLKVHDGKFDRIIVNRAAVGEPMIRADVWTLDNHEPFVLEPVTEAWAIFPGDNHVYKPRGY